MQDTTLESRPFTASFRRWWLIIVLSAIVAGVLGYVVSSQARPTYQSTIRLLIGPFNADADTQKAAGTLAATYTYYVTSGPVLDATAGDVGLAEGSSHAWSATRANTNQLARILSIEVESDDPATAAKIANTLAENLADQVTNGSLRPEGELTVIEPAEAPTSPIGPRPLRTALASAIAAFLGVLALAVLIETTGLLRRRRRPARDDDVPDVPGTLSDQSSAR